MSDTLNPTNTFTGVLCGVRAAKYEMDGRTGTYFRAYLAVGAHGSDAFDVAALKVPAAIGPQLIADVKQGVEVEVECSGFAKPRAGGRSATIEWTVRRVTDHKSGIVIEHTRAAA